jgi:TP901 family phage tail tape measure protein
MMQSWQSAGDSMTGSLGNIDNATSGVVSSIDGVAQSISDLSGASSEVSTSASQWTAAVGNYDKAALEAIYSTEELVEMGLKTQQALTDEQTAMQNCERAAENLSESIAASSKIQDDLSASMQDAASILDELSENEEISSKSKDKLVQASEKASAAMEKLSAAQDEAAAAMAEHDALMASGTKDLNALESSAQRAQTAAERLADANAEAAEATEELDDAAEEAQKELDDFGNKGSESIKKVAEALTAAGIVKLVQEIGSEFLEAARNAETFETSIAQLQTIAGEQQISQLTKDINELSAETGSSASSLAEVAYNAISAGSAVEASVATAEAASKLATAGFTDTTSALSVLSTAMNSYGDEAGTAEEISDSLIMVQNLGVTTVAQLSQQMGKAIATASGYSVSLGNLEAAYVSTTKAGIATAESTTYINGMLNELGSSSSDVSAIIQETTGKTFGQMMQSGSSLADVLGILYDSVNGDSEAFMNLWGSTTAGMAASAIVNQGLEQFNENLEAIENSAGATEEAYSTMADTTEYARDKMENSMLLVSTAFGTTLNPMLEKLYNAGSKVLNGVSNFINEHPKVVKAASAIAIGLGVITVGVVGVTTVVNVLIPAITNLGIAINTAMGPIGWVTLGITALTAAVAAFVLMADDAQDETLELTSVSKKQYDELQELNAEYDNACEVYGETSQEASRLKAQIDDLSAAFGDGGQTIEEFANECQVVVDKHNEMVESFSESSDSIKNEELDNLALIAKLEQLATTSGSTTESQQAMKTIIDQLNDSIDGLNLTYTDLITNQEDTVESLRQMAQAQAEQELQQEKLAKAHDEVAASAERSAEASDAYTDAVAAMTQYDQTGTAGFAMLWSSEKKAADAAAEALETAQQEESDLQDSLDDTNARIKEIEELWGITEDSIVDGSEDIITEAEAINTAYECVADELTELCEKYDEAYEAAKDSLEGQFGLFDEASTKSEEYTNATVENAQKALESQLAYWESYNSNIDTLRQKSADDLGMTQENYEALMSYVQDGSEEAAGLAASMVNAIENGNEDALVSLGQTFTEVQAQKDQASQTIADWQTNFSEQMDDILAKMEDTVSSLNMEDGAAQSATDTMEAYIANIKASQGRAVAAAESVANAVKEALSTTATVQVSVQQTSVSGHATGTTNAEDVFIAGEEGPELIVGKAGSTVFPAEETEKIVQAVSQNDYTASGFEAVYKNGLSSILSGFTALLTKFSGLNFKTQPELVTAPTIDLTEYATGTTDSESNFIAGEEGPELVLGHPDSTVFPAEETDRLIGTIEEKPLNVEDEARTNANTNVGSTGETSGKAAEETKRIYLEIAGTGGIDISSRTNKTDVLEIIQEHIKPVLMRVIRQEIYEEGDLSYEF